MDLNGVLESIVEEYNASAKHEISIVQNKATLGRKINIVLGIMDRIVSWNIAIKSFSKSIAANKNSASVGTDMIFKPIWCKVTISGNTWPLDYIELTDFERMTAEMDKSPTNSPTLFTVGGNKVRVGPGLLTTSAIVAGEYQRKLTDNDIPYLPADMVIDGVLMRMLPKGNSAQIAAWSGWKEGKQSIQATYKVTAHRRSSKPIDKQIQANQQYLRSVKDNNFRTMTSYNFDNS